MATTICRHIRINGDRCNALSLKNDVFCYYHARSREQHRNTLPVDLPTTVIHRFAPGKFSPEGRKLDPLEIQYFSPVDGVFELALPPLDDRESIQVAISLLLSAVTKNRIDLKRASLLLYGLQIASANAKGLNLQTRSENTVTDPVHDQNTGLDLAPDEEPGSGSGSGKPDCELARLIQREIDGWKQPGPSTAPSDSAALASSSE
jgi:hypothetical protein